MTKIHFHLTKLIKGRLPQIRPFLMQFSLIFTFSKSNFNPKIAPFEIQFKPFFFSFLGFRYKMVEKYILVYYMNFLLALIKASS